MALQWTPSMAVGIREIDHQHQELFERVNTLLEAMSRGKGRHEIAPLLAFLGQYVNSHFQAEEAMMLQTGYPGAQAHKAQHAGFVRTYTDFVRQVDEDGPAPALTLKIQRSLGDWLVQHIGKMDQAFGQYYAANR